MTTVEERSTRRERMILYIVVGVVIGALLVVALVLWGSAVTTRAAEEKAEQLITRLNEEGAARIPNRDQLVRLLGEDGGAVCANPNEALSRALLQEQLSTGAGGTGARPIIADDVVVEGTALVLEVYCPEELPAFQQYVAQLQFADVAG